MSGNVKTAPQTIIDEWQTAYERANNKPAPPMTYEGGWFVLRNPYAARYRRKFVEGMTGRLIARIDTALTEEPAGS